LTTQASQLESVVQGTLTMIYGRVSYAYFDSLLFERKEIILKKQYELYQS
jgi:hypothetical protein